MNSDLVNKIINLISRTVPLLHRHFQGKVSAMDPQAKTLIKDIKKLAHGIEELYRNRDTAQVVRDVVAIADLANRYLQDNAPWDSNKNTPEQTQQQLTTALWAGKVCLALLKPILPTVAEQTEKMLKLKTFTFDNLLEPLEVNLAILPYTRLLERLDMKKVTNMTEANQSAISTTTAPTNVEKIDSNLINIDEFMKVDLRAALVLEAKTVDGADKLISLSLDVGPLGKRHVLTGLRPHVEPEALVGKTLVLVYNLAPRKMKFGVSEGMILAGGDKVPVPVILTGVTPGDKIR